MLKMGLAAALLATAAIASAATLPAGYHVIPGQAGQGKGPDGNSVFIDAPAGLILVDTGRHPEHRDKILDYAKQRNRPVAAIVNTHWHFDHTTGNAEILAVYPQAELVASWAIEGDLFKTFNANSRKGAEEYLASGKATPEQQAEIKRAFVVMDNLQALRPTRPVTGNGSITVAGKVLEMHLAEYAATEGDLWFYDPSAKVAVVGDLVVGIVPFMDTACADGWKAALEQINAVPFTTLIPGHGPVMSRTDFQTWKVAYDNFLECGRSQAEVKACVDGWQRDAAQFIVEGDRKYVGEGAEYYLKTRIRSKPEEQQKFCRSAVTPAAAAQPERG